MTKNNLPITPIVFTSLATVAPMLFQGTILFGITCILFLPCCWVIVSVRNWLVFRIILGIATTMSRSTAVPFIPSSSSTRSRKDTAQYTQRNDYEENCLGKSNLHLDNLVIRTCCNQSRCQNEAKGVENLASMLAKYERDNDASHH